MTSSFAKTSLAFLYGEKSVKKKSRDGFKTMGRTRVGWWPRGCSGRLPCITVGASCLLPPGLITVLPSGHCLLPSQVKSLRLPRVKLAQHLTAQSGSHIRSQAHPPACTLSGLQWQQPSSQSYWNPRKWDVGKYSKYRLLIEIRPVSSFPREQSMWHTFSFFVYP